MYRRHTACILSGLSVEAFKTLSRRDQLPILSPSASSEDGGHSRFSSDDVLRLAVFQRFSCEIGISSGLSPASAAEIAGGGLNLLNALGCNLLEYKPRSDQWVGYTGSLERHEPMGGGHVAGSLNDIFHRIRKFAAAGDAPGRIFIVNASEVLRAIKMRAEAVEIEFPGSDSE